MLNMIQPIALSKLAINSSGELDGVDIQFSSVAIDTRTVTQGDLFVAIKGDRFDGHEFIQKAIDSGCSSFVINSDSVQSLRSIESLKPFIKVENTVKALGECSRINRENFLGKVIGLTGSSGKTSTKNMLECILTEKGATCATQGNFNNEIGVPLTLLSINEQHKYAVVEMGARRVGDIQYLAGIVQPDVAILLNAGTAHIDIFGNKENIIRAKGEIFTSLKDKGFAVVNADDSAKQIWLDSLKGKDVLTFSINPNGGDVFAEDIVCREHSCLYIMNYAGKKQSIELPVPGLHNVSNSLAAASAAIHLGFDLETISKGLAKLSESAGRLMSIPCSESLVVIDDSYNANPTSMKAAIDVLSLKAGYKIAVLGEMAELGDFSKKLHLELANYILGSDIDRTYLIGPFAEEMAELIGDRAYVAKSKQEILESLESIDAIFGTTNNALVTTSVLIKGSRSTEMDELVNMIIKKAAH